MPYYHIIDGEEESLVRANNRTQARSIYSRNLRVSVASPETLFRLARAGVPIIDPELEELDNVEYRAHEERMAKSKKAVPADTADTEVGPT